MRPSRPFELLPALLAVTALTGCASFLPESGPSRSAVQGGAATTLHPSGPDVPYALLDLSDPLLDRLAPPAPAPRFVPDAGPADPATGSIGLGDEIGVTIFEAAPGGLFIPPQPGAQAGNFVTLPAQQVDEAGTIAVPFAGELKVAHRTPQQVERAIEAKLRARALEPQAIVTVLGRRAGSISVLGDVGNATRFSLDPGGERVLGAIARAGGPRGAAYEAYLTLQRDGTTQHAVLSEIAEDPSENISLMPGDILYVSHKPRYFLALGATGQTTTIGLLDKRLSFDELHLSLADALAKAGGLEDDRANAQAVFLYRFEPRPALAALGLHPSGDAQLVPTVFALDLSNPHGLFLAKRFEMQPEDTIFVSNAPATDIGKFLTLVLPAAYSAANFNSGLR